ncbi:hypothetical protein ABZX95_41250 [Streptomyces sp. NPDC004232]|uniref:hypothetical protein n=1 Tax=Streptomyces sp. NPDC004232 TaxID=3154454 RepID=UPI0033B2BE6C
MTWEIPAFFLGIGLVSLVAAAVGGHLGLGLVLFGITAICSLALILLGRRSETYRGLAEQPDERFALIGQRAWAATGVVLTLASLGAMVGDLASGGDGHPYYWQVPTAAVAYVGFATFWGRRG